MRDSRVVPYEDLKRLTANLLLSCSLPEEQAWSGAEALVFADLAGVESHGVSRLVPYYIPLMMNGTIDVTAELQVVGKNGSFFTVDGGYAFGPYVGRKAIRMCVESAARTGSGIVSVSRGTHFGMASYYTRLATDEGLVGIAITNGNPAVVAPGGEKAFCGTNAISVALPHKLGSPFVMDIGLGSTSLGNLLLSSMRGEKVPSRWGAASLLREMGLQSEQMLDPAIIYNSRMIAPLGSGDENGQYKGIQLGVLVDIALALFGGGLFSFENEVGKASSLFLAIDPHSLACGERYYERIESLVEHYRNYRIMDGFTKLRVPGERVNEMIRKRRESGIPVEGVVLDAMVRELEKRTGGGRFVLDGTEAAEVASR